MAVYFSGGLVSLQAQASVVDEQEGLAGATVVLDAHGAREWLEESGPLTSLRSWRSTQSPSSMVLQDLGQGHRHDTVELEQQHEMMGERSGSREDNRKQDHHAMPTVLLIMIPSTQELGTGMLRSKGLASSY